MSDEKPIETAFVVYLYEDGTYAATAELPETSPQMNRSATLTDILKVSDGLVTEIRDQQLSERVVALLASVLLPEPQGSASDRISSALADRDIHPESPTKN